jgi:hypothetical protein
MRQGKAIAAAVLALVLSAPLASRAMTSPALLEPAALAGTWTLTGPDARRCHLVLKAVAAADGQGLALELGDCARWDGPIGKASNWRTSNDGFGLATADRSTVLFFSNEGDGLFAARARDGNRYELRRSR